MREKKRENGESYEWKQSQAKKWRGETNENEPNRDQKRSVLPRRATIRYLLHETSKYPLLFMLLNGCHFSNVVVKQKEKRKRPTASDRNVWALKQWQAFRLVRAGFRAHMGAQDSLQLYSPGMSSRRCHHIRLMWFSLQDACHRYSFDDMLWRIRILETGMNKRPTRISYIDKNRSLFNVRWVIPEIPPWFGHSLFLPSIKKKGATFDVRRDAPLRVHVVCGVCSCFMLIRTCIMAEFWWSNP